MMLEMELHPVKILRPRKVYIHPTCFSVLNYAAVRGYRRVVKHGYELFYLDEYEPVLDVIKVL